MRHVDITDMIERRTTDGEELVPASDEDLEDTEWKDGEILLCQLTLSRELAAQKTQGSMDIVCRFSLHYLPLSIP